MTTLALAGLALGLLGVIRAMHRHIRRWPDPQAWVSPIGRIERGRR